MANRLPHHKILFGTPKFLSIDGEVGLCQEIVDPEIFFPLGEPPSSQPVWDAPRAVCASCPLIKGCGEYAVQERIPHGMWGGLAPSDREAIWAQQAAAKRREELREKVAQQRHILDAIVTETMGAVA